VCPFDENHANHHAYGLPIAMVDAAIKLQDSGQSKHDYQHQLPMSLQHEDADKARGVHIL
jgi:hypothetical protein